METESLNSDKPNMNNATPSNSQKSSLPEASSPQPSSAGPERPTTARITVGEKSIDLPLVYGSEGEVAINIDTLRSKTGIITLDTSLASTGSCHSSITFLDGERGILRYRGYPIEQLAAKSSFVEVAYLLLYGELPAKDELFSFRRQLNRSSLIHEDMRHFFDAFPTNAHPMGILSSMVASLSTFYPVPEELTPEHERQLCCSIISQVRSLAAISYKKALGEPVEYPSHRRRFVENFLHMMFNSPVVDYQEDSDTVRAVDLFFLLHADHEQNCSTSTVRLAGSSQANVYAVVSAGISALWGKRHGGANQDVIAMLERVTREKIAPQEFVERAKGKKERLPGFGHRVYKTFDPRAKILKEHCHKLLQKPGAINRDPLFEIALQLEDIALHDDYFLSRNLYPNVDFYSGLILRAVGIPYDMFTVLFAIGRTPGWLAHWREMIHSPDFRILRPRQIYEGATLRDYTPIDQREAMPR